MDNSSKGPAIGIDLGTSNWRVAIWDNKKTDKIVIIRNDQGNLKTSAFLSFTDESQEIVGEAAESQAARNFKNTFFEVKRSIGQSFSALTSLGLHKSWPFALEAGPNDSV